MIKIHPLQTGRVRIRKSQRRRKPGGLLRVLFDNEWTEWLPVLAWAIQHPEGTIVVDTGDTSRTSDPEYFPAWHPYYRRAVEMDVHPEEEIGPRLHEVGIDANSVKTVVLTHFHTDHAGGLHHFPNSRILVQKKDYARAQGVSGRLQGFLPHRWPSWFQPTPLQFKDSPIGPFARSCALTEDGSVQVVPTPGHTPGHVSVLVRKDGLNYFLAGDTSYTQRLLLEREPDGISPSRKTAIQTLERILELGRDRPTVYLPTHDPESVDRLRSRACLPTPA